MKDILFATANAHKILEIASLLGPEYRLKSLAELGIKEDIPEDGDTLEENALAKARFLFERFGIPCFADDTGLEVAVLGGAPGVRSARYAEASGDMMARSAANIRKLLEALSRHTDRNARFRTVIAYLDGEKEWLFEGIVNGTILEEPTGSGGFGYDPVFVPQGSARSFAEMSLEEKNALSHRARALKQFLAFLHS
jgi:XTP/dITP diphosphohydrolase